VTALLSQSSESAHKGRVQHVFVGVSICVCLCEHL
jgi:hypothetical protein